MVARTDAALTAKFPAVQGITGEIRIENPETVSKISL
jgi:hypothetical protein